MQCRAVYMAICRHRAIWLVASLGEPSPSMYALNSGRVVHACFLFLAREYQFFTRYKPLQTKSPPGTVSRNAEINQNAQALTTEAASWPAGIRAVILVASGRLESCRVFLVLEGRHWIV